MRRLFRLLKNLRLRLFIQDLVFYLRMLILLINVREIILFLLDLLHLLLERWDQRVSQRKLWLMLMFQLFQVIMEITRIHNFCRRKLRVLVIQYWLRLSWEAVEKEWELFGEVISSRRVLSQLRRSLWIPLRMIEYWLKNIFRNPDILRSKFSETSSEITSTFSREIALSKEDTRRLLRRLPPTLLQNWEPRSDNQPLMLLVLSTISMQEP